MQRRIGCTFLLHADYCNAVHALFLWHWNFYNFGNIFCLQFEKFKRKIPHKFNGKCVWHWTVLTHCKISTRTQLCHRSLVFSNVLDAIKKYDEKFNSERNSVCNVHANLSLDDCFHNLHIIYNDSEKEKEKETKTNRIR